MVRVLSQVMKEYENMGFPSNLIKMAYENLKGDESRLIEQIIKLSEKNQSMNDNTKQVSAMEEQQLLSKAIQESIDLAKEKKIQFEPLNPEQRLRKSGVPVGLKNIGNTCYFNSLLQTYFYNPNFVKEILSFKEPQIMKNVSDADKNKDPQLKRRLASVQLAKALQLLFAGMISSDKKYLDPTSVITSVVDDYGNELPIGDQKDIAQFNLFFLARIQEAISLQDKYNAKRKMQVENPKEDSPSKIGFIGEHSEEMMKRSSIKISQQSIITKEFIGKHETTFINEKENISKVEYEMFTLLYVNVRFKQLYTAFEQVIISEIDDYRNQKGEVVSVEKQCWIQEAPRTLFFQIQRVVYDKEKQALKKIHDTFDFPREFYIDPFLEANKRESLIIRSKVNKLRQQKAKIETHLRQLQNYSDSSVSLDQILNHTINLLKKQSAMEVEDDPTYFTGIQGKIHPEFINLLSNLKTQTESRIRELKGKRQALEVQIEKSYMSIRKTQPYVLQSILIHEGQAQSGHYYSYTFDDEKKVWRKYNDINVSEESEEQVLKEARGLNMASAYCLVYVMKDQLPSNQLARTYKLSSEKGYGEDIYSTFVPTDVRQLIQSENLILYQDIINFKCMGFVTKVMDNYVKRFENMNELFRKLKIPQRIAEKKKNMVPTLINLPLFVKTIETDSSAKEYKAAVMESTILSFGPKQDQVHFEQILGKKLINLSEFKRPKNLYASKSMTDEYIMMCNFAIVARFIYEMIAEVRWPEALSALNILRNDATKHNPAAYFGWMSLKFSSIVLVRLLLEIEQLVQAKQFGDAIHLMRILCHQHYITNNIVQSNVRSNLVFWLVEININLPEEMQPEAEAIKESILNRKLIAEYSQLIPEQNVTLLSRLKAANYADLLWNVDRQEDVLINELNAANEKINNKMKGANFILNEMKKVSVPLTKQGRDKAAKGIK